MDLLENHQTSSLKELFHITKHSIHFTGSPGSSVDETVLSNLGVLDNSILTLDLSTSNCGFDLRFLRRLPGLLLLALDRCSLGDDVILPHMQNLRTLSLNKNNIHNVDKLLRVLDLPSLSHLSLIGNPCNPHPCGGGKKATSNFVSTNKDELLYQKFRVRCLSHLLPGCPHLQFLDDRPVTQEEMLEALEMNGSRKSISKRDKIWKYTNIWNWNKSDGEIESDDALSFEGSVDLQDFDVEDELRRDASRCLNDVNGGDAGNVGNWSAAGSIRMRPLRRIRSEELILPAPVELAVEAKEDLFSHQSNGVYDAASRNGRSFIAKLSHTYRGKNSEGNRFIKDDDL